MVKIYSLVSSLALWTSTFLQSGTMNDNYQRNSIESEPILFYSLHPPDNDNWESLRAEYNWKLIESSPSRRIIIKVSLCLATERIMNKQMQEQGLG